MFGTKKATDADIRTALQAIPQLPAAQDIVLQDGHALITIEIDPARVNDIEPLRQKAEDMVRRLKGINTARIILTAQKAPVDVPKVKPLLSGIKHVIAVASGKGGVGKSTVAANLAVALSQLDLKVGLLDADVYGPSVPMLMGVREAKPHQTDDYVTPVEAHGIKLMSMGFMVAEDTAMIWRGPMVQSALLQMIRDVQWGELDILIIDMPPGTGDTQLTIAQRIPLAGAVIVSTPQDIALLDAVKAVQMFQKLAVPILGLVENMSLFCCPHCGQTTPIFGHDGAKQRAKALGVNVLGDVPLDPIIREVSDAGTPVVLDTTQHAAQAFMTIAANVITELGKNARAAPKIIFEA